MDESARTVSVERRRCPRYRCTATVEIFQSGNRWGWGSVNELCHGGCYIEIAQLLPVGTEAPLRLTMDELTLEVVARVASNHPLTGMGMEFLAVAVEQECILQAMLKRVGAPDVPYSAPSVPSDSTRRPQGDPHHSRSSAEDFGQSDCKN